MTKEEFTKIVKALELKVQYGVSTGVFFHVYDVTDVLREYVTPPISEKEYDDIMDF